MKDYCESLDATIDNLKERFNRLQKQKDDIKFYEDAVIDNFVYNIRSSFNPQFPFNADFFKSLWNKKDEKHDESMSILLDILQRHLFDGIKTVDDIMSYGYDMYGVCVYFTVKKDKFELIIPINQNINRHNSTYEYNNEIVVNWEIGEFRLLKQDEAYKHSWSTVWSGYDLDECDYFKNKG